MSDELVPDAENEQREAEEEAALREDGILQVSVSSREWLYSFTEMTISAGSKTIYPVPATLLVMDELLYGSFAELLAMVGAVIGSILFTGIGLLTQRAGIHNLLTGHSAIGLWEAYMGGLALFVGLYLLGYRTLWLQLGSAAAK